MSAINITQINVLDNPTSFLNPFQFEISYECVRPLNEGQSTTLKSRETLISHNLTLFSDLEWKLVYVGSAQDPQYDQVLESVLVGPINVGSFRFVFQVGLVFLAMNDFV